MMIMIKPAVCDEHKMYGTAVIVASDCHIGSMSRQLSIKYMPHVAAECNGQNIVEQPQLKRILFQWRKCNKSRLLVCLSAKPDG